MTGDFLDTFAHPAIHNAGVWWRKEELAETTKPGGLRCVPKVRCRYEYRNVDWIPFIKI